MMSSDASRPAQRPIRRVLIANRGEIAVRIARTCHEMGIAVVAVYSTADARALHVLVADEAVCIGPPPAVESYLNIDAVIEAARKTGADAVHPGYGFLAENPRFAAAVEEAGLIWIGPPPDVIALMGDKVAAKELARQAGVPTVPGYMGEDQRVERLLAAADEAGYPVLLKAAAGGGGKGMRAVHRREELPAALEGARREARSAFGDDRVFLEKLLVRPRHVEVQVLADAHGHCVYLGDRDCSLQRRHQKVIEEAPAPGLSPKLHASMGSDAVRLALSAGYVNAGTVEFLLDENKYYFLEMNTRIQVEHPVTEMVTGLDLVRLQIEIACGADLPFDQDHVKINGHAFEARIYAEDAAHSFLPSTGTLRLFDPPAMQDGRNDVGVYRGFDVSPYYDPLLAKLVTRGRSRHRALDRLRWALDDYRIAGLTTNLDFLRWAASTPEFEAANVDVAYVEREWRPDLVGQLPPDVIAAAAALDLAGPGHAPVPGTDEWSPWKRHDAWRQRGVSRCLHYQHNGRAYEAHAIQTGPLAWRLTVEGHEFLADHVPGAHTEVRLREAGKLLDLEVLYFDSEDEVRVAFCGQSYTITRRAQAAVAAAVGSGSTAGGPTAPMPGTVVKVAVEPGQRVTSHTPLVVLEAMKMEHVVEAPNDGVVTEVLVKVGDLVPAGSPVVSLEPA